MGKTALLYLDIDLHNAWQTEEQGQEAMRLIEALFWALVREQRGFLVQIQAGMNVT